MKIYLNGKINIFVLVLFKPAVCLKCFFNLLKRPEITSKYEYLLFIEPDVYPVRRDWLWHFVKYTKFPDKAWYVGVAVGANDFINANSFYSMDLEFIQWLIDAEVAYPEEGVDGRIHRRRTEYFQQHLWPHFIASNWMCSEGRFFQNVAQYPSTLFCHIDNLQFRGNCSRPRENDIELQNCTEAGHRAIWLTWTWSIESV